MEEWGFEWKCWPRRCRDNRVRSRKDARREQGEQDEDMAEQDEDMADLFPYRLPALRLKYI